MVLGTKMIEMKTPNNFNPVASIIIPTHERYELLINLLESLQTASDKFQKPIETIIVDSSSLETSERIQCACNIYNVQYIKNRNNVREKRNIGVKIAKAPILIFVDSDCQVTPEFISEHFNEYSANDEIGGVLGLTKFVGRDSWLWSIILHSSITSPFTMAERSTYANWGPTCNISYRKKMFEELGIFDTSFPFPLGGDDTDFGLRVTDAGYKIKCNPRAIIEHTRETWLGIRLIGRRIFRWGRMHFYIIKKHPNCVALDFPKVPGIFFLMLSFALVVAIVKQNITLVLLPFIWMFSELLFEILFLCSLRQHRFRNWWVELGARLFNLLFEFGTHLEGLRNGSFAPFYLSATYSPKSQEKDNRRIVQIWASILILIVMILGIKFQ